MGGDATFSGTTYQAKLVAYTYVFTLAQARLGWLHPIDDTPVGVSGETGGAGDDLRVELRGAEGALEVQAKHGLSAGRRLHEWLNKAVSTGLGPTDRLVLVVDGTSSRNVRHSFARDLERLRSGRQDNLKEVTEDVLREVPGVSRLLQHLWIVSADLDSPSEAHYRLMDDLLRSVLEDPEDAVAALGVLVQDANEICAKRLRRTRVELVELLKGSGIPAKPAQRDERWLRELDFTKRLVDGRKPTAALRMLRDLQEQLEGKEVAPLVWYRLHQHRAAALLYLDRHEEAISAGLRALDHDVGLVHAHQTVALAALVSGKLDLAEDHARDAITKAPADPSGWIALSQIQAAQERPLGDPPKEVEQSPDYRVTLAQIAANRADWETVEEITRGLLESGIRRPRVLYLLCMSLSSDAGRISAARWQDVERLSSEMISTIGDDYHPLTPQALVFRGRARMQLGREKEGHADLEYARELNPEDPELMAQEARDRVQAGDVAAALEVLRHPDVESYPGLLAMRARLLAQEDPEAANADLMRSIELIPTAANRNQARLDAAEAAAMMDEWKLAEELLADVTDELGPMEPWAEVLRGRLAFSKGDAQSGIEAFEAAIEAESDQSQQVSLRCELASHLRSCGQREAAVEILREVDLSLLPDDGARLFAATLADLNLWEEANEVIQSLSASDPLPAWALRAQVDIALRQEDPSRAVEHLLELIEVEQSERGLRFELARQLVGLDRHEEAREHLDFLRQESEMAPQESMLLAQLEFSVGDFDRALERAFRSFRLAPVDPEIHRAFVNLHLVSDRSPETPSETGPGTSVLLRQESGQELRYTIYADPPIDPLRGELSIDQAREQGLLGLALGDTYVRRKGAWNEEKWEVASLVSAVHHSVQDAMLNFEDRFPGEPFFLHKFTIGEDPSIRDFAPVITTSQMRRERVERALSLYREEVLPLGVVGQAIGIPTLDLLPVIGQDPDDPTPIYVEWSDQSGRQRSLQAAREATLVVDDSALSTIVDLGMRSVAVEEFELVAPLSIKKVFRRYFEEAERELEEGKKTLGVTPDGRLAFEELEPGSAPLKQRFDRAAELLEALEGVALQPRPLGTLGPPDSKLESLRTTIGKPSFDALFLAKATGHPLLVDDLGLRRLAGSYEVTQSTSSVALLQVLHENHAISANDRDDALLRLVSRGYVSILPSEPLFTRALELHNRGELQDPSKVFSLLSRSGLSLDQAAALATRTIKKGATAAILVTSVQGIARACLEGLSHGWPRRLVGNVLTEHCSSALMLLPEQLDEVREAVRQFLE